MYTPDDFYRKVGDLIRARREDAGLSQEDLAGRVNLTRTSISNFESARQRIQIDKLFEIAEVLEVEPDALLPQHTVADKTKRMSPELQRHLSPEIWRALPSDVRSWAKEMSAATRTETPLFDQLQEIRSLAPAQGSRKVSLTEFYVTKLLAVYDAKAAPVPVDKIVCNLGIDLRYGPCLSEIASFVLEHREAIVLAVNSSMPKTRQRFAIAHSLGHLLLQSASNGFRFDRNFRAGNEREEIEANNFASELLIPTMWLQRDLGDECLDFESESTIFTLAGRYKVSAQVMTGRLLTLPPLAELPGKKRPALTQTSLTKAQIAGYKAAATRKAKLSKASR